MHNLYMNTYFVFEKAKEVMSAIDDGTFPNYLLYGAWHLQQLGQAEVVDIKTARKIHDSTVVINVPKYAPALKKNGNRVILINLNSNHILNKNSNRVLKYLLRKIYSACDVIMCLDESQIKPIKKLGVKTKFVVNPLFVDTTDLILAQSRMEFGIKNYSPYYLSSGFDAGRDFSVYAKVKSYVPVVTLGRHNPVKYTRYCEVLNASLGVTLMVTNSAGSSDLSGSTTVFEALCMKKPVIINPQPWLKNFPSKNIYIYKSVAELEELLNSKPKWIEDNANFEFEQYFEKLKKILKIKD